MGDTIITVEGHFDYHHPAERGTVTLSAGFEGPDRGAVVTRTTGTHSTLVTQAQQLSSSGSVTWFSADRMRAWSERPWNSDGKQLPLVHHASVSLEVKFADLGALAEWAETIATVEGVTVAGIRWALTEVTKARITAEAQNRAVQDAVSRATAYAQSLGLSSVRPLAVADPGMLGDESRPQPSVGAAPMSRALAATSGGSGGLDLKPEDITVASRVHARFAAS
ncbi:SIMPL domain-containing protein [Subtercola boreus]|uniref:SIMPL domain-containing protein n=1 Tax=Subtercola boreus TaxID=120213 RepID=A0A3E0WGU5_9MICO|nr:SIMPL domain-containing protein [Subtercola boreus]RFA23352.1 SIMPL domain-containing protein [Subtercola boreus]RFA23745.1 SIMPL domain-containing protein [Subtercola boreus]RFA29445.1 SIMPL domain-containing protein [Subtercola boreus]